MVRGIVDLAWVRTTLLPRLEAEGARVCIDLALLALLSDCGLRAQEAADMQLRDLDLAGAMLTVRYPAGLPPIGSEAERKPLLMKRNVAKVGQLWEPGLTPNAMRKHLPELGQAPAERIQAQAAKEPRLERVAELEALARQLAAVSPYQLRHGLAYRLWRQAMPAHIQRIMGQSRVSATLKYGSRLRMICGRRWRRRIRDGEAEGECDS